MVGRFVNSTQSLTEEGEGEGREGVERESKLEPDSERARLRAGVEQRLSGWLFGDRLWLCCVAKGLRVVDHVVAVEM